MRSSIYLRWSVRDQGGSPAPFVAVVSLLYKLARWGIVSSGACLAWAAPTIHTYIANDDHTDYVWTADAATYEGVFLRMTDKYLDLADATSSKPSPYRSRFNFDGSFWIWTYERNRTPAQFERLINRLKDGHFSSPLNTLVVCYGAQPVESVLRGMYYAGRLERRYPGLKFPLAVAMENRTLPLGVASLWAGSGALYSWHGICGCAPAIAEGDPRLRRDNPMYWATGQDGQRVLMKWYPKIFFRGTDSAIGTYIETGGFYSAVRDVPNFLDSATFTNVYKNPATGTPYLVRGAFGYGGDNLEAYTADFPTLAQLTTTADRQVYVSNQIDFFERFKAMYENDIPVEQVAYGNEWDVYTASMAETTASVKRAVERLRPAELMATLVSVQNPSFFSASRVAARDLAFTNLGLYWEHNWTADSPKVTRAARAAWQQGVADNVKSYVATLHDDAATQLGSLIAKPAAATNARFFVLNPLGWTRTDYADYPYSGSASIHVRDLEANVDVPHQLVTIRNPYTLANTQYLRILASDLPAAGYKIFEIRTGPGTASTTPAATLNASTGVIENALIKVDADGDGAIASLIAKAQGNTEYASVVGNLKLNDIAAGLTDGTITIDHTGPVSSRLKFVSTASIAHTTYLTLYRDSDRIDIDNEITANFGGTRYWSFSYNLTSPAVRTEEVGAIILNKLKSDGGDYSAKNARYDHTTVNHFADISNGANTLGLTISSPDLSFAKLGNTSATATGPDTTTRQLRFLAGGQVDGGALGIVNQNGATFFLQRFSLRPHGAYSSTNAMKFALEHQNPLVTGAVTGNASSPYPALTYALLGTSSPDVLLWSVKPAEEGIASGVIARWWNVSPAERTATITSTLPVASVKSATHVETDTGTVASTNTGFSFTAPSMGLRTYRINLASGTPVAREVIVDDKDANATRVGVWNNSTSTPGSYGGSYLNDGNTGGGKSVRFTPTLTAAGSYKVYARWPAGGNRATNVPIAIVSTSGTSTVTVNQERNSNTWVLLGTYNFNAGTAGHVTIRNEGANQYVIADAVRFTPN